MNINDKIKQRRSELQLTLEEVAHIVGVTKATVQRWESGLISNMRRDKIVLLAKALQTTPAYILGIEIESKNENNKLDWRFKFNNIKPIGTKLLPVIGSIACGKPVLANEERELYVEVGANIKADFILAAQGDGMKGARIFDGDLVFIKQQDMVVNGEIAAVIIDDSATLKRVFYYPESQKLILQAENSLYEPLVYIGEELNQIHILGKAIAFQSDIK